MTSGGFWAMGGYARFVWPCFACAFLVLGWNVWSARRFHAAARRRTRRAIAMADENGDGTLRTVGRAAPAGDGPS